MTLTVLKEYGDSTPETASALPKHSRNFGVLSGGLALPIDQGKLRKLINIAVTYKARLSALKVRDLALRLERWQILTSAEEGCHADGLSQESYWRNKSLFVRRLSSREEFGTRYLPELTEIACLLKGGARAVLTIREGEHQARFDVISANGQSGYALEGLDYDLALSEVFSLLSEVEGVNS
jgi:hypothetical protein